MDASAERNRSIAPEELSYGIDVTGLDPASLTDALRAVIADVMMDPLRMSTWLSGFALAEQNVGLNMLRRLGGEASPAPVSRRQALRRPGMERESAAGGLRRRLRGPHPSGDAISRFGAPARGHAPEGPLRDAVDVRRDGSQQRALAEPRRRQRGDRDGGLEPGPRTRELPRRRREQRRLSAPGRSFRLRTGREPGGDARARRDAQRAYRTHRLRSPDAASTRDTAAVQPAVDQQVLHHGPRARAARLWSGRSNTATRRS